jgi:hypothetical protein
MIKGEEYVPCRLTEQLTIQQAIAHPPGVVDLLS